MKELINIEIKNLSDLEIFGSNQQPSAVKTKSKKPNAKVRKKREPQVDLSSMTPEELEAYTDKLMAQEEERQEAARADKEAKAEMSEQESFENKLIEQSIKLGFENAVEELNELDEATKVVFSDEEEMEAPEMEAVEETSEEPVEEMKHDKKDKKKDDMKKESTDEEGISEEDEKEVAEDEEKVDESKLEMAPKADMADHADNKASPIAKQQSGGMKVGGKEEAGRPAPKAQDMGGTTKPDMKKV